MVEYRSRLDQNNKIYIPKSLRRAGFTEEIIIIPNYSAAIIYPEEKRLPVVRDSVKLLLRDIENRIKMEVKADERSK